jgi:hypothetical protein
MKMHILCGWFVLATVTIATAQVKNQALIDQYNQNIKSSNTISFEENKGQVKDQHWQPRPDVLFSGESNGLVYHIRENGISYQLSRVESWKEEDDCFGLPKIDSSESRRMADEIGIYRIDVNWLNANQNCEVIRGKALYGYTNYYNVPDGVEPALNVLKYEDVTFRNVWKGVDLHYFSRNGQFESDWILEHAEDYIQIRFEVKGAELSIDKDGFLVMHTPFGEIREGKLKVYQEGVELRSEWVLNGNIVSFIVHDYDEEKSLRIDPPARIWGTYYGGSGGESGKCCATDSLDNIYIVGLTTSLNAIATTGAHQSNHGGGSSYDAFLVKFNSNGVRQWGTYYGGSGKDYGFGCATDSQNNIYIVGYTQSPNAIATTGAHQDTIGGDDDAFLVKFDLSGLRLWGTYYGGSGKDNGLGCATDSQGNIYLSGFTYSLNAIATTGAHQSTHGGSGWDDAFLVKFDSNGLRLWGTYYGGNNDEMGDACITDALGNVYMTGYACSISNIATSGAHQSAHASGLEDAFLVKFDSNGLRLWCTYYGGSQLDRGLSTTTDVFGNVYLSGQTASLNGIATSGAHQSTYGGGTWDAFLVKFDSSGLRLWGTYYGGSSSEQGFACATDDFGNVYLSGQTSSLNGIATSGAHQSTYGGGWDDAILVKFNSSGYRLWGTYYGGSDLDVAWGCSTDSSGSIFLAGHTYSMDSIATSGAHQSTYGGGSSDAFLIKFNECQYFTANILTPQGIHFCSGSGDSLLLEANIAAGSQYQWLSNNLPITGATNYQYYAKQTGDYSVLIVDTNGCRDTSMLKTISHFEPFNENICVVTIDTVTSKVLIVWEKTPNVRTDKYLIYRESSATGIFDSIGFRNYFDFSTFIDTVADIQTQSYRYQIATVDSCGTISIPSNSHKTIHLTSSVGINNEVNLIWSPYEGMTYTTHRILRSTGGSPFALIGSVPSNSFTYTDLLPPSGIKRYVIEVQMPNGCNPSAKTGLEKIQSYSSAFSNFVAVGGSGVNEPDASKHISIYPNPANDEVTIKSTINLSDATYELLDILGRTVLYGAITSDETKVDLRNLSSGVYLFMVLCEDKQIKQTVKLMVE